MQLIVTRSVAFIDSRLLNDLLCVDINPTQYLLTPKLAEYFSPLRRILETDTTI